MKRFLRAASFVLILLMAASVAMAAGKSEQTTTATAGSKPTSWISDQPMQITWLYSDNPSFPFNKAWLFLSEVKKRTNVDIQFQVVPQSDYLTKLKILLNSGDIPDIFYSSGLSPEFAMNGVLLPISDYLDKLPSLQKRIDSMGLQGDLKNLAQLNGKNYDLPVIYEAGLFQSGLALRLDMLKKYNLGVPKTYQDLYAAMKTMKSNDPQNLPMTMFWGANEVLYFMAPSWRFYWPEQAIAAYYDRDKKDYEGAPTSAKMRSLLTFLNKAYAEGLIDPEILTADLDQWTQKIVTGKSLVTFCWSDQLPSINSAGQKSAADFDLENVLPLSVDASSGPMQLQARKAVASWAMPASVAKKPYFDNLMKFVDWLFYSDEGAVLTNWGVEGKTFVTKDGARSFTEELLASPNGASKQAQIEYGLAQYNWIAVHLLDRDLAYVGPKAAAITQQMSKANMFVPVPPLPKFTADQSEQVQLLSAPILDYVTKSIEAFITGKMNPATDWDAYVKNVNELGLQKVVDMNNAALPK